MMLVFNIDGQRRYCIRSMEVGSCHGSADSACADVDKWRGRTAVQRAAKWARANTWSADTTDEALPEWVDTHAQAAVDRANPLLMSLAPGSSPVFLREFNTLETALAADDKVQEGLCVVSFICLETRGRSGIGRVALTRHMNVACLPACLLVCLAALPLIAWLWLACLYACAVAGLFSRPDLPAFLPVCLPVCVP